MPDEIFENFEFPPPRELEGLPGYSPDEGNYGGYEDAFGGEYGNTPRLEVQDYEAAGNVPHLRRFEIYDLQEDTAGEWSVAIAEGVVEDEHILNVGYTDSLGAYGPDDTLGSAVRVFIPTIDKSPIVDQCGTSSGDFSPPRLSIFHPDETWIYVCFQTTDHGQIKPVGESEGDTSSGSDIVYITATTEEMKSTPHVPPNDDGEGGQDGFYCFLIGKVCGAESSGNDPQISHEGVESDIVWQQAWVLQNTVLTDSSDGDACPIAKVYKKYSVVDGEHKLRVLKGNEGVETIEKTDEIYFNFRAENVGTPTVEPGGAVYVESDGESSGICKPAKFRKLSAGPSMRQQIVVNQSNEIVQIYGNGINGSLVWLKCDESTGGGGTVLMEWEDGLITTPGAQYFKAGCDSTADPGGSPAL